MSNRAAILLASVSILASGTAAMAQQAPQASAPSTQVQEIVVTGSRIRQSGYAQPTPVTTVTGDQLQLASPQGISAGLNQLPQFAGSISPAQTQTYTLGQSIGNFLNLRDVGINRTLILLDGTRVPPTTATGQVDVDVLPELLISRVDVVTGGVSAVYGSDAVSGVVNYILDKNFTGVKGVAQTGVSTYGDGDSYKVGVAFGHGFDDDKGHVLFSVETNDSDAVSRGARPLTAGNWFALPEYIPGQTEPGGAIAGAPGTASNPLHFVNGVTSSLAPYGEFYPGVGSTGLGGMALTPTGGLTPLNFGSFYVPGSEGEVGGGGFVWPTDRTLIAGSNSQHVFGRLSYDLTPNWNVFAEVNASQTVSRFGDAINVIQAFVFPNNAFLTPALQSAFAADPADPYALLLKIPTDLPLPEQREEVQSYGARLGAHGDVAGWNVEANYIYGHVHQNAQETEINQQHLYAAIESVSTPGGPVCLSSIIAPGALPGCVPYNPFVQGANSPAVVRYLMGTSVYDIYNETNDFTLNVTGKPFSTWAGPVSVAFGGEYRTASMRETSNSNPADPFSTTGLIDPTINPTQIYNVTNTGTAGGSNNVKEASAEVLVPLAKDDPFAKEASVTGAVRYTDYSTSGGVTTWKLGATWSPIQDIRFRVTRSRDIRAPTLFDLFAGQTSTRAPVFDAQANTCGVQGCTASNGIYILGGGNPDLKPEIGNTFTGGVVLQPRFLSGFEMSLDYYDLRISDAITTLTPEQIIEECYVSGGTSPLCSDVTRPGGVTSSQPATAVFAGEINAASWRTKGVDIEASYRLPLDRLASNWNGAVNFHMLANYVESFTIENSAGQPTEQQAGYTDTVLEPASGAPPTPIPHWRGSISATYVGGPFTILAQERYVGSLKTGGPEFNYVYAESHLPAVFYTDLTVSYDLPVRDGKAQLFATVNNLFNQQPPLFPSSAVPGLSYPTIQSLYDVMGRYITVGAKFRF